MLLGLTCNAQNLLNGSYGGDSGGTAKADVVYKGKYYRGASISEFRETTVQIRSKDGSVELPIDALPMSMKAEHKAWLKANTKATPAVVADLQKLRVTGTVDSKRLSGGILIKRGNQPLIFLKGFPGEEKLADGDPVDVVAAEDGVIRIDSASYHAYKFLSK